MRLGARIAVVTLVAGGVACGGRPLDLDGGGRGGRGAGGSVPGAGGAGGRVDAGTDPGVRDAGVEATTVDTRPAGVDARAIDALDAAVPKARTLTLVLKGAPWYATQFTQGIAVDALNRVYVGDSGSIFMVDGTSISTYLTAAEAVGPALSDGSLGDFDIAPDGQLYIVASGFLMGMGNITRIVRSSAIHQAEPWVDVDWQFPPRKLAVIDNGTVTVATRDRGLWTYTAAGGRMVYTSAQIQSSSGCATEDLVAVPSGVFLYQPGCNGYPLLRGNVDGTGVGVLYATAFTGQPSPVSASNFICSARDPSGGFYFIVENSSDYADRLYHVAEDAQVSNGLTLIATVPTFGEAEKTQNETFAFGFCSLATARDGTVFFQTYHQLWKVSPP